MLLVRAKWQNPTLLGNSTIHLEALDNMKKNIEGIHLLWRQMILINKKLLYDKLVRWLIATSWGWMDLRKKRMDGPIVWPTSSFGHGHCTAGQWPVVHKPIITLQIITTTIIKWYGKTSSFSWLLHTSASVMGVFASHFEGQTSNIIMLWAYGWAKINISHLFPFKKIGALPK